MKTLQSRVAGVNDVDNWAAVSATEHFNYNGSKKAWTVFNFA
jgi:hypothetical protein